MKIRPSGESGRSAVALLVILASFAPQTCSVAALRGGSPLEGNINSTDFANSAPAIDTGFVAFGDDSAGESGGDAFSPILVLPDPATPPPAPLTPTLPPEQPDEAHPGGLEGNRQLQDVVTELQTMEADGSPPSGPSGPTSQQAQTTPGLPQGGQAARQTVASGGVPSATHESAEDSEPRQVGIEEADAAPAATVAAAPVAAAALAAPVTGTALLAGGRVTLDASVAAGEEEDREQERADIEAVSRLQSRLEEVHRHTKKLRHSLHEAVTKGHNLEKQLTGARGTVSEQQHNLKVLSKKAHDVATALSVEWNNERVLKWKLSNATMKLRDEQSKLDNTQQLLAEANRTLAMETRAERAAEAAEKREMAEVKATERHLRASQNDAQRQQKRAKVAEARAAKIQKVVEKDEQALRAQRQHFSQSNQALEDKVAQLQAQLAQAQAVKQQQDITLNASLAQGKRLKMKVSKGLEEEKQLRSQLDKERSQTSTRESVLGKELGMRKHEAETESAWETDLRRKIGALRDGTQRAVRNLTQQLGEAHNHEQKLQKDRQALEHQLAKDVRQKKKLQKQVGMLRERVKHGDQARKMAEEKAEEVSKQLAQAQAVARQLEGTVPQLLEQAHLAREARDAEQAMRTQAQQAIAHMQNQYSTAVDTQIKELAPVVSRAPQAVAKPSADDMSQSLGGDLGQVLTMDPSNTDALAVTAASVDADVSASKATATDASPKDSAGAEPDVPQAPVDLAAEADGLSTLLATPVGV